MSDASERLLQALRDAARDLYRAETHRQMEMYGTAITSEVEDFKTSVIEVQHAIVRVLNEHEANGADAATTRRSE